jgi:hypothetical protein
MSEGRTPGWLGAIATCALVFLTLVLLEGLSSLALVVNELAFEDKGHYSEYDSTLGWVPIPSLHLPDRFGPGRYLRTDARGLRADRDVETAVPPGRLRILCSGDSFTFGEGVANPDTWCHLLSKKDSRLETANLGFPGYGVDQSYLRYLRTGEELEHAIHLFAFIGGDVHRMGLRTRQGYAKPFLRVEAGELVVDNVPVPRGWPWLLRKTREIGEELRSVRLGRAVWSRLVPREPTDDGFWEIREETYEVARKVFQELQERSDAKGVSLVFVYLPTPQEIGDPGPVHHWAREVMAEEGFDYIDLTEDLGRVPEEQLDFLFIPPGRDSEGHYSERGNQWVATLLWQHLQALPRARARLEAGQDAAAGSGAGATE